MKSTNLLSPRKSWRASLPILAWLFSLIAMAAPANAVVVGQVDGTEASVSIPARPYVNSDFRTFFSVNIDGQLGEMFGPKDRYSTPLEFLRMLNNDEVQKHLEIVEYQRDNIKEAIANLEGAIAEFNDVMTKNDGVTEQERERIFGQPVRAGIEIEKAMLLPHQFARLRQILTQYEICRVGLIGSMKYGALSKDLEFPPDQLAKLQVAYVENLRGLDPALSDLRKKIQAKLLNCLTPEQRKILEEQLWEKDHYPVDWLFLFVARSAPEFTESLQELADDLGSGPRCRSLLFPTYFLTRTDGMIEFRLNHGDPESFDSKTRECILSLLKERFVLDALDLSERQRQKVDHLRLESRELFERIHEDWNSGGNLLGMKAFQLKWEREREQFARSHGVEVDNLLFPEQEAGLEKICQRIAVVRAGLCFALVHGPLSGPLKLKYEQRDELTAVCDELRTEVQTALIKMEKEVNGKTLATLDETWRKKLAQLVGEDLNLEKGYVELHALILKESEGARIGIIKQMLSDAKSDLYSHHGN